MSNTVNRDIPLPNNKTLHGFLDINKRLEYNISVFTRNGFKGTPLFTKRDIENFNLFLFKWRPDNYNIAYVKGRGCNQIKFVKNDTIPERLLKIYRRCNGLRFTKYINYTLKVVLGEIKTWSHG